MALNSTPVRVLNSEPGKTSNYHMERSFARSLARRFLHHCHFRHCLVSLHTRSGKLRLAPILCMLIPIAFPIAQKALPQKRIELSRGKKTGVEFGAEKPDVEFGATL